MNDTANASAAATPTGPGRIEQGLRVTAMISLLIALFAAGLFSVYAVDAARRQQPPGGGGRAPATAAAADPAPEPVSVAVAVAEPEPTPEAAEALDAVSAERDRMKAELESLQARLTQAGAAIEQLSGRLAAQTANSDALGQALADNARLNAEVEQARTALAEAEARVRAARQKAKAGLSRQRQDLAALGARYTADGLLVTLGQDVLTFPPNAATLSTEPTSVLERIAEVAARNPGLTLVLRGHTDSAGPEDANLALSEQRAEAVRTVLVQFGIDGGRTRVQGLGETEPVADNASAAGRARNRRVEVLLVEEG
jgi:flagellar motor protein MotB